jgi:hypothetical protein
MAIPESQLDTWSAIGASAGSRDTYATVKLALDKDDAPYHKKGKNVSIFLQGSYGNDTNVFKESDVDVVIQMSGSTFYYDLRLLTLSESQKFNKDYSSDAPYGFNEFKTDVLAQLTNRFGEAVTVGSKAICIAAGNGRRKADVVVCVDFRRYVRYENLWTENYVPGICFFTTSGSRIVNFPKQHCESATTKHQATSSWYKPMVRIFKNMRNKLVAANALGAGIAPSYYIEGLLYNAPNELFGTKNTYGDSFVSIFNWLDQTDRSNFVCANEQYKLLDGEAHVTWSSANCTEFLNALRTLWNDW